MYSVHVDMYESKKFLFLKRLGSEIRWWDMYAVLCGHFFDAIEFNRMDRDIVLSLLSTYGLYVVEASSSPVCKGASTI